MPCQAAAVLHAMDYDVHLLHRRRNRPGRGHLPGRSDRAAAGPPAEHVPVFKARNRATDRQPQRHPCSPWRKPPTASPRDGCRSCSSPSVTAGAATCATAATTTPSPSTPAGPPAPRSAGIPSQRPSPPVTHRSPQRHRRAETTRSQRAIPGTPTAGVYRPPRPHPDRPLDTLQPPRPRETPASQHTGTERAEQPTGPQTFLDPDRVGPCREHCQSSAPHQQARRPSRRASLPSMPG